MTRCALVAVAVLFGATACAEVRLQPQPGAIAYMKPNARLFAYTGHHEDVWIARLDGSRPRKLGAGVQPSVSPDGRYIAFGHDSQVLLESVDGAGPVVLYTLHGRWPVLYEPPVWAPDSEHVAFETEQGLRVVDVFTRQVSLLPSTTDFSFSPDSRRIVYEARGDLYVVQASGGRPRQLTDDRKDHSPVWGKPGIAFVRLAEGGEGDVWLSDGRPRHARQLTHRGVAFSPEFFSADGTKLLAAIPPSNNGQLWAADVRTGHARPLTPFVGDLYAQGLSSDGRTVLAAVGCGGMPGPYGYVETIPFSGGRPHVIVRGPCGASWNAP
jgi:Tol biopolymer transport system component